jgi:hypothetical protein
MSQWNSNLELDISLVCSTVFRSLKELFHFTICFT